MATINIQPADINLTDFSGGYMPDLQEAAVPPHGLLDVNNLLPDRETGTLETRKGFVRVGSPTTPGELDGFEVRAVHPFSIAHADFDDDGKQYLIAVLRKRPKPSPREIDDVQVWLINLSTDAWTRIDTNDVRIWNHYAASHWGETIDNVYYGGSEKDPIYGYRPFFQNGATNPAPYDPDASMGQYAATQWAAGANLVVGDRRWDEVTFVNDAGNTVTRKFVFVVIENHITSVTNRPKDGKDASQKWINVGRYIPVWATATAYEVGDKVSVLVTGNQNYPRGLDASAGDRRYSTFICIRAHTSGVGEFAAPPGNNWEPYRGPKSNVACYHGSRLFMRDSDAGSSTIRYTGRVDSDGFFDITEWESSDTVGAGQIPIRTGDGDDVRAMHSLGNNLVICKRYSTHVLTGLNPSTWVLRDVSTEKGAFYKNGITEREGLVYFLGDEGLSMTDGVTVREVPQGNMVRDWLRDNVDLEESNTYRISMATHLGFIWISFPEGENVDRPNMTLVYDPATQSFWKLDMATNDFAVQNVDRVERLFFAKVNAPALVMQYAPGGANGDQDDTGVASVTPLYQDIPWMMKTGWTTFGPWKEQRRVRRLWALLRASSKTVTVKLWRNFKSVTPAWTAGPTATPSDPVNYVEGKAIRDYDSHAICTEISGTAAPVAVMAIAIETEYRRKRYHRTGINA
jgi:hypothetical protein